MKLLFLLVAALLLFGCLGSQAGPSASPSLAASPVATASPSPVVSATAPPAASPTPYSTMLPSPFPEPSIQYVTVTARKFEFEPSTITVKKNVPVRLTLVSEDVEHGLSIPGLGIDLKAAAGGTAETTFTAATAGDYAFHCSVYCGSGHGEMTGVLRVTD